MLPTAAPPVPARTGAAEFAMATGLVVSVVGTFLPWLTSGRRQRNSYQAAGPARRLLHLDGALPALLHAWPFVSLAVAAALALLLLRRPAWGAALAVIAGGAAGGVAIGVLNTAGNTFAQPADLGPTVTLGGAALVWLAVLLRFLPSPTMRGRTT